MVWSTEHSSGERRSAWGLADGQHGVVAHWQLVDLGLSRRAIDHRLVIGRLHQIHRGVYAVGRPGLTKRGLWMSAVLACGPSAVLSHRSAAELMGIGKQKLQIEVSVRTCSDRRREVEGVRVHRRVGMRDVEVTQADRIPVTAPVRTLVDLAGISSPGAIERLVNEADRLDLIDPETLRAALSAYRGQRGVARLRLLLDRRTFRLTRSRLEQLFLPLAERVELPVPLTQVPLNGFKVDFYWPDLGLVVETDGLRYHRTPAEQVRDRLRDQAHTAAGLSQLRFTHEQVRYDPEHVIATMRPVARRLLALRHARAAA